MLLVLAGPLSCAAGALSSDSLPRPAPGSDTLAVSMPGEVIVTAFEQEGKLSDQGAPVAYLPPITLARYGDVTPVSAFNAVPGVRMEQRSPGSYRLNIRGSSLRSPFGVRNVKIYYDGIPLTDPGGGTYLNQLSGADYGSVEIIKGPAGSLYGAGTGGVVLITGPLTASPDSGAQVQLSLEGGSYGERKVQANVRWGDAGNASALRYTHFQADGYRQHSASHSDIASYEAQLKTGVRQQLSAFIHYTDLYYETPGGLTRAQYEKDPRAARPAAGPYPSAVDSRAAVYQKAFLAGIKNTYRISRSTDNTTVLYGAYTDFTNPTVRNYEYRKEPHFGGRTVFSFRGQHGKTTRRLWVGAEAQQGYFSVKDLGNRGGGPDTLQTDYRIRDFTALVFAQGVLGFGGGWKLTGGVSVYHEDLALRSLYPAPVRLFTKQYHEVLSPRIAVLKKITPAVLVYGQLSKGFSPPSVSEVLPSTSVVNTALQAEEGIDYELGSKGSLVNGRLYYEASVFLFRLRRTITVRRDSSGADYFVNAGNARQKGAEASLSYILYEAPHATVSRASLWLSAGYLDFRYGHYLTDGKDYSGNRVPGVAPVTLAGGLDLDTRMGLKAYVTWQHTGRILLDDAGTERAAPYELLGVRLAYDRSLGHHASLTVAVRGSNLLNERYSLGDDINAIGGRYYNAAAGATLSVMAGFSLQLGTHKDGN